MTSRYQIDFESAWLLSGRIHSDPERSVQSRRPPAADFDQAVARRGRFRSYTGTRGVSVPSCLVPPPQGTV